MKKIKVLSLFDGISVGQQALKELGYDVEYYASEIKDIAIKVTQYNHPNTNQVGDVRLVGEFTGTTLNHKPFDLLIGGSPCQNLSIAKSRRKGLDSDDSGLFWEYVRILKEIKPKYFLLENVARMKKQDKDIISKALGVEPIRINSSLVSAQLRDRLYWTNIPNVTIPKDRGIILQSLLTSGTTDRLKSRALLVSDSRPLTTPEKMIRRYRQTGFTTLVFDGSVPRYFNQEELEKLQTMPVGYTKILTRNQSANVLGDSWTLEVIKHILSFM